MKFPMTRFAALLLLGVSAGFGAESELPAPVRVGSGLVQGEAVPGGGVVAFKGIPYAAPPVGDLRWREPQPTIPWAGVRTADTFGASCPQPPGPSGQQPASMSEDCLFLNVWTPAKSADERLAVLFFIHGGAGVRGSGNLQGGELARKGIVVVTVNYRLGLFSGFGHPELTAESPHRTCGTYGMLDLIAALRWVRDNIAAFGGDPARVTIAGHSSGASAMHYLVASPVATGLFHRAIGVSFPYDYLTKPHTIPFVRQKEEDGVAFAKIKRADSPAALRRIPAADLVARDPAVEAAKLIHLGSGAARDGWAVPATYGEALDRGLASDVPTLTGITADDYGPPVDQMKTTVASFARELAAMFGVNREAFVAREEAFLALCPVASDREAREIAKRTQVEYRLASIVHWATRRARTAKTPVYTYIFDHAVDPERGAWHGADLAYAFNVPDDKDRPWTETDRRVADAVSSYWVNFVKTGDPNGAGLPEWSPFSETRPATMSLGPTPFSRPIAVAERMEFYKALLGK